MVANKFNSIIILNDLVVIFIAKLVFYSHSIFGNEPLNVSILFFHPYCHIEHNLRVNFPAAKRILFSAWKLKHFIIISRMKGSSLIPGIRTSFYTMREI